MKKRINTLLVDDEMSALEGLTIRLQQFDDIEIVGEASSVDEAVDVINQTSPDLIFLDIEMPGQSGFELIKTLQPETCPVIVFVTAYHQYAIEAFEVNALDYLLKPIKMQRLQETLQRVRDNLTLRSKASLLDTRAILKHQEQANAGNGVATAFEEASLSRSDTHSSGNKNTEKLIIQDGRNPTRLIPFADIFWIDAAGDYMCIHTCTETVVMRTRLKNLLQDILPPQFLRIHKSTIINLHRISHLEPLRNSEFNVKLENGKILKVSRTYGKKLKASLRLLANKYGR